MKELEISIPRDLGEHILRRCGAFPLVMLIHLDRHFITRSPRRKNILKDRLGEQPFSSNQWLLAYEARVQGWLTDKDLDSSDLSQFMKDMINSKVVFFDLTARPWFVHTTEEGVVSIEEYAIEDLSGRYDDDDEDGAISDDDRAKLLELADLDDLEDFFPRSPTKELEF